MPELPEVESIKVQLNKYLVGHKLAGSDIAYSNFQGDANRLNGAKIYQVRRFGKVLSLDFDNGYSLLSHIKLTGQYLYRGPNLKKPKLSKKVLGGIPGKHTHIIFKLDNNGFLFYNDVRKFGWLKVIKTKDVEKDVFIKKLGPEPLTNITKSPLKALTPSIFKEILSKTKRGIKVLLMDQTKIGGIGNIYANDALWLARIHPERSANSLKVKEIKLLFKSIEEVLKHGLKQGGASELSYVTPDGSEGNYQNVSTAYGKVNVACPRQECQRIKAKFTKKMVGGRGTYYCKNCQK